MSTSDSIHWALPRRELLELLESTRADDAPPRRPPVTVDRRAQTPTTAEKPPRRGWPCRLRIVCSVRAAASLSPC